MKKGHSQNFEEHYILDYFRSKPQGTLLSIGENDGETLSNTFALIEKGWGGTLVEPSKEAFSKLCELYKNNPKIECFEVGISDKNGIAKMYHSGTHLNKGDTSLLSTMSVPDYEKWKDCTAYKEVEISTWDVKTLLVFSKIKQFDFITIDAEGFDMMILQQMDLVALGCSLICVEHNGLYQPYRDCISQFGHKTIYINAENLIMGLDEKQ